MFAAGWLEVFDVAVYDNVCYVTGPEPIKLKESDATAPGAEVVACDSVAGRLGLTVCYDLRFPELYQVRQTRIQFDRCFPCIQLCYKPGYCLLTGAPLHGLLSQKLRFEMGAQVLLVPSAFTRPTGASNART